MIKGAIEVASRQLVSGWIHCTLSPLRGTLMLAHIGQRCVGEGRVEIFRQDLLDAGLGDGYCGFHFPVVLNANDLPAAIVLRPQDWDVVLMQANSRVIAAAGF